MPSSSGTEIPLTVLHVAQPTDAGVAICAAQFARDQVKRGWNVVVACPPERDLPGWVRDAGALHRPWPARRSPGPWTLLEMMSLRKIIRAVDPTILHLHSAKAGLAGRAADRGRHRTIFQPHAWSFHAVDGLAARAARAWERRAAQWSDAIVCVSEDERRAGERAGVASSWAVIPNGLDLERYPLVTEDERVTARARLQLGEGPTVVCIGRLSRQKGQDLLLSAWPRVLESVPAARLLLVGDGPARSKLERAAPDGVRFTGWVTDTRPYLAASDVSAAPSRWEAGLSLAVMEAMAAGRSVVATEVEGSSSVVAAGAGVVVPGEDPDALATALVQRLADADLRRHEGAAARSHLVVHHDLRRTTEAIAELYAAYV